MRRLPRESGGESIRPNDATSSDVPSPRERGPAYRS